MALACAGWGGCGKQRPRHEFSAGQLARGYERKCKACVAAALPGAAPAAAAHRPQLMEPLILRVLEGKAGFACAERAGRFGLEVAKVDEWGAAEVSGVTSGMICLGFQGLAYGSWEKLAAKVGQTPKPWFFKFTTAELLTQQKQHMQRQQAADEQRRQLARQQRMKLEQQQQQQKKRQQQARQQVQRCAECEKNFSSPTELASHKAGRKHQAKLRELTPSPRCMVCEKSFDGQKQLEEHLAGQKHLKKLRVVNSAKTAAAIKGTRPKPEPEPECEPEPELESQPQPQPGPGDGPDGRAQVAITRCDDNAERWRFNISLPASAVESGAATATRDTAWEASTKVLTTSSLGYTGEKFAVPTDAGNVYANVATGMLTSTPPRTCNAVDDVAEPAAASAPASAAAAPAAAAAPVGLGPNAAFTDHQAYHDRQRG